MVNLENEGEKEMGYCMAELSSKVGFNFYLESLKLLTVFQCQPLTFAEP